MKNDVIGFVKAFRTFAIKGNVVDLAVAVIVGGAFGKIVTSMVADVVMPLVNPLIPGGDWRAATVGPGVKLGSFAGTVVDFIIIALVMFTVIRSFERFKQTEEPPTTPTTPPVDPRIAADARLVAAIEKLTETLEKRA